MHRSHNRIESHHQLRPATAQVGGKKGLTGRTDIEITISNQRSRLIANALVHDNAAILSRLLDKCEAGGHDKALALVTSVSPVAWQHIHMNGHYTFRGSGQAIELDSVIQRLKLA